MEWCMIRCNRACARASRHPDPRARPTMGGGEVQQDIKPSAVVDCLGLYCPMPIAMTKEAIEKIGVGEVLLVEADDPAAEEDIRRWANRVGHKIVKFEKGGGTMRFFVRRMK